MILFIDLRGQIHNDNEPHFAFYNTTSEKFILCGGDQTWDSLEDFEQSAQFEGAAQSLIERCKRLIPSNYFNESQGCTYDCGDGPAAAIHNHESFSITMNSPS